MIENQLITVHQFYRNENQLQMADKGPSIKNTHAAAATTEVPNPAATEAAV